MTRFAFLRSDLASTPKEELIKVVSYLWEIRFDISPGEFKEIGSTYKIALYRTSASSVGFLFMVTGVHPDDDAQTISRVFDEVMNDAL